MRCPGLMASYRVHSGGSVSTRDPVAFVRDCSGMPLRSRSGGKKTAASMKSGELPWSNVRKCRCSRSFEKDKDTFDQAYSALKIISPGTYHPALSPFGREPPIGLSTGGVSRCYLSPNQETYEFRKLREPPVRELR